MIYPTEILVAYDEIAFDVWACFSPIEQPIRQLGEFWPRRLRELGLDVFHVPLDIRKQSLD